MRHLGHIICIIKKNHSFTAAQEVYTEKGKSVLPESEDVKEGVEGCLCSVLKVVRE